MMTGIRHIIISIAGGSESNELFPNELMGANHPQDQGERINARETAQDEYEKSILDISVKLGEDNSHGGNLNCVEKSSFRSWFDAFFFKAMSISKACPNPLTLLFKPVGQRACRGAIRRGSLGYHGRNGGLVDPDAV
ncbi:hypothetical protein Tco_0779167 [Tanacetum coccineum]